MNKLQGLIDKKVNLGEILNENPDKLAVIGERYQLTYRELNFYSDCMAAYLRTKKIKSGDPLIIFMPDCVEYIIVYLAAFKLNLNLAPANALSKSMDLHQLVQQTEASYAIVLNEEEEALLNSLHMPLEIRKVSLDDDEFWNQYAPEDKYSYPTDLQVNGVYLSTSGSTGRLKFVVNSYLNEIKNALLYVERMLVTRDDVIYTALPITQKFGMAAMLGSLISGATFVISTSFHVENVISLLEQHKVSVQYGVPTIYIREMHCLKNMENMADLSSLRVGIIAGSSVSRELLEWFDQTLDCRLLNCYGTSEIGGLTMTKYDDPAEVRYSSCGSLFAGATIEIIGEQGELLPTGSLGEIVCQTPWSMTEYLKEKELTESVLDEKGRFHTGDIARIDEKGNLFFGSRKKSMIIRGGYNVFPAEIERILENLSYINESCVLGYKDPCLGERICAYVSLKKKAALAPSPLYIRNELKQSISKYKLPDRIIILDEIPKLPNGKYNYSDLRKRMNDSENPSGEYRREQNMTKTGTVFA